MSAPPAPRRPAGSSRSLLDSPWLSAALVVVVIALAAAIVFVPGLLSGPGATPGPGASGPSFAPASGGPSAAPTFVRPTPSPMPTFTTYVVKAGDSLSSIATAFRTTPRSIAWWNRGAHPSLDPESPDYDPNRIEAGWVLVVLPDSVVDENNPPTPSPGPSTTPPGRSLPPTGTPAPGPTAASVGSAILISHGSRAVSTIALTFDMGGRLDPAVDVVRWLIDHQVHATLFPTGRSGSQTAQGRAAMQLAATRLDLFDVANHSWDHPDFRGITAAQMRDQLVRTEDAITPIFGTTKPWFRPPFGGWNDTVRAGVGAAGWKYVVMWDVDTIDWRPVAEGGPTTSDIVAKIRDRSQGGSIVLMHLGGWNTLEALPGILAALGTRGLHPVTLGEMLDL